MADLNSSRVFAKALAEIGLSALADQFEGKGWTSHADFAYACGVQPGQPEHDARIVEEVAVPFTGNRGSPMKPKLRRLFHESWTYQLAELRRTPVAAPPRRGRVERPLEQWYQVGNRRGGVPGGTCLEVAAWTAASPGYRLDRLSCGADGLHGRARRQGQ